MRGQVVRMIDLRRKHNVQQQKPRASVTRSSDKGYKLLMIGVPGEIDLVRIMSVYKTRTHKTKKNWKTGMLVNKLHGNRKKSASKVLAELAEFNSEHITRPKISYRKFKMSKLPVQIPLNNDVMLVASFHGNLKLQIPNNGINLMEFFFNKAIHSAVDYE